MRAERKARTLAWLLCRGVWLVALLSVGCALHESADSRPGDSSRAEEAAEETTEKKAPPFFIYGPGAGLTIENADRAWSFWL